MRYYISDCHFYHENLNKGLDKRGFENKEAMNEYMIRRWNEKVRKNDEVVILGDFSMAQGEDTNKILEQLNGHLFLIRGNHDHYLKSRRFDAGRFGWVKDYEELHDDKRKVVLSHYPIVAYNGQYKRDAEGNATTYMLYGHVHDSFDEYLLNRLIMDTRSQMRYTWKSKEKLPIPCQMINCFCMFSDYMPQTLDEWILTDAKRREEMAKRRPEDYDSR